MFAYKFQFLTGEELSEAQLQKMHEEFDVAIGEVTKYDYAPGELDRDPEGDED